MTEIVDITGKEPENETEEALFDLIAILNAKAKKAREEMK